MWAVVKYQISRVQRSRRTTETDILADNNHSCGLRKLEIDFTDDYYHRFRHIIKQPETYDYYYCAGKKEILYSLPPPSRTKSFPQC